LPTRSNRIERKKNRLELTSLGGPFPRGGDRWQRLVNEGRVEASRDPEDEQDGTERDRRVEERLRVHSRREIEPDDRERDSTEQREEEERQADDPPQRRFRSRRGPRTPLVTLMGTDDQPVTSCTRRIAPATPRHATTVQNMLA